MWIILVTAVMLSVTGYYSLIDQQETAATVAEKNAESLASNMAIYRSGVIAYYTKYPASGNVSKPYTELTDGTTSIFPNWYQPVMTDAQQVLWQNYIQNGQIFIYANTVPKTNIISDIVKLSQNSINAGEKQAGRNTLISPVHGDTGIPLPAFIPDGSPVWLAATN